MQPNIATLGRWIRSWVTPNGQIYGFHNHSVWGTNPYKFLDYTSGHTTFAAPFLGALAICIKSEPNEEAISMFRQLVEFQTFSFQADGQYNHIGFQVGESSVKGLIHNMVANIGILLGGINGKEFLGERQLSNIRQAVDKNIEGCKMYGDGKVIKGGCCNQEYARIWTKLLYMELFECDKFDNELKIDLENMIDYFHVLGYPDNESIGTYRSGLEKDAKKGILEPAEYYGLMIEPLLMAYERYGIKKYLDEAVGICLHVIRSCAVDKNGCTRFHRYWFVQDEKHEKVDSPMLISGMGLTLLAMHSVLKFHNSEEIMKFLDNCDKTYAYYQTEAGSIVAGTGWGDELDTAPCSAWHAQDFLYLVRRHGISKDFWNVFFSEYEGVSVILSDKCFWVEKGNHWTLQNPTTVGDYHIHGRKDKNTFTRDFPDWTERPRVSDELRYKNPPVFIELATGMYRIDNGEDIDVFCIAEKEYKGKF